jgi:hypothetical protein
MTAETENLQDAANPADQAALDAIERIATAADVEDMAEELWTLLRATLTRADAAARARHVAAENKTIAQSGVDRLDAEVRELLRTIDDILTMLTGLRCEGPRAMAAASLARWALEQDTAAGPGGRPPNDSYWAHAFRMVLPQVEGPIADALRIAIETIDAGGESDGALSILSGAMARDDAGAPAN